MALDSRGALLLARCGVLALQVASRLDVVVRRGCVGEVTGLLHRVFCVYENCAADDADSEHRLRRDGDAEDDPRGHRRPHDLECGGKRLDDRVEVLEEQRRSDACGGLHCDDPKQNVAPRYLEMRAAAKEGEW